MNRKSSRNCLNRFESVGTCLTSRGRSNNVGTAVLRKIGESSEFERISGFVGPVGTVGQEIGVLEKKYVRLSGVEASLDSARDDHRKEVSDGA